MYESQGDEETNSSENKKSIVVGGVCADGTLSGLSRMSVREQVGGEQGAIDLLVNESVAPP